MRAKLQEAQGGCQSAILPRRGGCGGKGANRRGVGDRAEAPRSRGQGMRQDRGTAEIDHAALRANFEVARQASAGLDCIAVVKADAYGHGAVAVSKTLVAAGASALAVVTVDEAVELRDAGIEVPILLFGGLHSEAEAREASERELTPTVHHEEGLRRILLQARQRSRPWKIHCKVDTGMRRMGLAPEAITKALETLSDAAEIEVEGLFTHLACADDPDLGFSLAQLAEFRGVLARATDRGLCPPVIHVANSAALLAGDALREALPEATACRPGLMLYGARPAPHFETPLRPVMTLRAPVVNLRDLKAGESVGYGATYRCARATRVATLPMGYADGVPVALGNRGAVWLRGARRGIAGRVSMDYFCVDLGGGEASDGSNVVLGDAAVLFGRQEGGGEGSVPTVEAVAEQAGTIPYELLVRVGARISRQPIDFEAPAG